MAARKKTKKKAAKSKAGKKKPKSEKEASAAKKKPDKKKAVAKKPATKKPKKKATDITVGLFVTRGSSTTGSKDKAAQRQEIKALLTKGKQKGFVTMDEVNDALPDEAVSSEQIDEVLDLFYKSDVEILDKQDQPGRTGVAASKVRRAAGDDDVGK